MLRDGMFIDFWDTLVRAGICMVVSDRVAAIGRDSNHPIHTLRFGLWQMQVSLVLAAEAGRPGGFAVRRRFDRAMSSGGLCHVAVGEVPGAERQSLRPLENLLQHVARRRDDRQLGVQTISQIAIQLPSRRSSRAAQSILRSESMIPHAA
jgi:hypothetical protein